MPKPTLLFVTATADLARHHVQAVAQLGVRLGASLHVLLVEPTAPQPFTNVSHKTPAAEGPVIDVSTGPRLHELVEVAQRSDLPITAEARVGAFATTVLDHAQSVDSRWIALILEPRLAGQLGPTTATAQIIARAACPVVVFPRSPTPPSQ